MELNNISVSRRDVWTECQAKYRYQYILKSEGLPPEFYLTYGNVIHTIAEQYVANKGQRTLTEVTEDVIKGNIPIGEDKNGKKILAPKKIPPDYLKRMPEHLRSIQKITEQIGTEGWTEYSFEYDLDPPHNRRIKGVLDRLICKGGKYWIIDYKTSKKGFWRKKNVTNDLQLRCYARVVQKEFNVPAEDIKAALYYLEGSELVAAKFSNQSLIEAEQELLSVYKQIENTNPDAVWGNVGSHCGRCSYRKICTFYKMT